ncbi:MAG: histidine phosphotransferase family protein [Ahrensia sp.]
MIDLDQLSPADLSALLCSRICHDIISPVGAINNGLELLEEEGMDEAAMGLITDSAANAAARLQFLRIAFGAAGSAGVQIDTGDAETVAMGWMAKEKPEFSWQSDRALMPKNKVKLVLNLLIVAVASIPRGGEVKLQIDGALTDEPKIHVKASGKLKRIPRHFQDMVDGRPGEDPIDAHTVQFYYTLLLLREAGMTLSIDMDDEWITYSAV